MVSELPLRARQLVYKFRHPRREGRRMRWFGRGALLGILAIGTAGAQTIPQLAVEVTLGQGGHTYSTPKDTFTTPDAGMNRLAVRSGRPR